MRLKIALLFGMVFFIFGLATLTDYGINWDTINHLPRGQVYLHYFLSGNKDFSDLAKYKPYWQDPADLLPSSEVRSQKGPLRSFYQNDAFSFNWYMEIDGDGHPPLSDILSSVFNKVLFGYLKIINDIDSYRVYGIFLAACLVGLIFFWISKIYGGVAGAISAISLAAYPLFWSESHFNTEKDVPETVFWAFFLFSVWNGVIKKSWKWLLTSGIFFGLALGTKFNIFFSIFVFLPWIIVYLRGKVFKKEYLKLVPLAVLAFILGMIIFYASWPFVWQDIIAGTQKVFGFYKTMGTSSGRLSFYPMSWIVYTTPIPILIFSLFGVFDILLKFKKDKYKTGVFFLLWFLTPMLRVSLPGANIYGGIRQIMEYIPGMAAVAGIGVNFLIRRFKLNKLCVGVFLFFTSFFLLFTLWQIHPNENVYFNELVGGLSGAKRRNIPSWGNTFGAAYRNAIVWINMNAEPNPKLVFAYELIPNIPMFWLRPDVTLSSVWRSGYLQKGEYAITLTYQGTDTRSYYDMYLERFLNPVYESKVDGVSVVKVWKNSVEYLKMPLTDKVETKAKLIRMDSGIRFDLGSVQKLSRLELYYQNRQSCTNLKSGIVRVSKNGESWSELPGVLPDAWRISYLGEQPKNGKFIEPFVGQEARFIDILTFPNNSCMQNIKNFSVFVFTQ